VLYFIRKKIKKNYFHDEVSNYSKVLPQLTLEMRGSYNSYSMFDSLDIIT